MVRVWRNECLRVFHDRLINEADKALVSNFFQFLVVAITMATNLQQQHYQLLHSDPAVRLQTLTTNLLH